jgi:hypothetical protein
MDQWVHHPRWYIYGATILSICWASIGVEQTPLRGKNQGKKENHVRSEFCGSVLLIGAVTTIWAVSYNDCSTSYATYLMALVNLIFFTAAAIAMILEYILDGCKMSVWNGNQKCWNCTEKTRITVIATNSYNISNLKLQALQSVVTISQIWNYKH